MAPLLKNLERVGYDSLEAAARIEGELAVFLDKFSITGPEMFLEAHGKLRRMENQAFKNAHILVDVQASVAGGLGKTCEELGLLTADGEYGKYRRVKKFIVNGTVENPDCAGLTEALTQPRPN
jgi:hypothetical protein